MRPNVLNLGIYIAADADIVAASQTPAAGGIQALSLIGGGTVVLDEPRQISITSADDETARVFVIKGTNRKGHFQIEAIAGVDTGAASTIQAFATVTEILVDANTTAAVQAGTAGTVVSTNWFPLSYITSDFQVALALNIPTGTLTPDFTVEATLSNLLSRRGNDPQPTVGNHVGSDFSLFYPTTTPFDHDTIANITDVGVTVGNIAFPVRAIRLTSNTLFTVNDVELEIVQSGHGLGR